ncbi:hypothetical protein XFF6990_200010 [Xanthomonas citri pv. fuscans]|uniref:Uncharacterized protein n=1 Tax=Xanthomonas campestris pv. phaseoli TaxID=317013 RepID=A0A7Z7NIH2_XANCH|nr:hypothetical protein XFF6990_200010 [Xanthomonas citri pv. fuscans]SOO25265.1 hypothetical protein XFF6991_430089 [Xanthomonas phaseoli pv. phaseoli]
MRARGLCLRLLVKSLSPNWLLRQNPIEGGGMPKPMLGEARCLSEFISYLMGPTRC